MNTAFHQMPPDSGPTQSLCADVCETRLSDGPGPALSATAAVTGTSLAPLTTSWDKADLQEALTSNSFILWNALRLEARYGLPLPAGIMISCAVLIAVAGPCYSLTGPHGVTVHPTLHLLMVTGSPGLVRMAVMETFGPLIAKAREDAANAGTLGEMRAAEIPKLADGCLAEARRLQAEADEDQARLEKYLSKSELEEHEATSSVHLANGRRLKASAEEKIQDARRLTAVADYARKAGTLVEGMPPSACLDPRERTFDHAKFNADVDARTWSALLGEKPSTRQKVAHRLAAGLSGTPVHLDGAAHPDCCHLSSLAVMASSLLGRLLHDDVLRASGLAAQLWPMLVEPEEADPASADEVQEGTGLPSLLSELHKERVFHSKRVTWQLAWQAEVMHLGFLQDVTRLAMQLPGDEGALLQNLPDLALKLAVLLRLGMHGGRLRTDTIDEAEMRTAIAVALRLADAAVAALEQAGGSGGDSSPDDPVVIEMVRKLTIKGPLRRRDLFRTYHDQRSDRLAPVLEQALALGLVEEREGWLLAATHPSTVSKELTLPRS